MAKTQAELEQEWGEDKLLRVTSDLNRYYAAHGWPGTTEQMKALADEDADAFALFAARLMAKGDDILASFAGGSP
jgi:hypothetical protein